MKAILLSIKPEWAEKIYSGEKKVEWRKSRPKLDQANGYARVYLYETTPVKKITGLIYVDRVERHPVDKVGEPLYTWGCVPREELERYAGGKSLFAWMILRSRTMETYNGKEFLTLEDFGLERPPQSWQYVEDPI